MSLHDVTAYLMGDPAARYVREPTAHERRDIRIDGSLNPRRSRYARLEVGQIVIVPRKNQAVTAVQWLRHNGRLGFSARLPDGRYRVERVE